MGIQIVAESDIVSSVELYSTIMFELQKRIVEIENNREKKAPFETEIADMVALVDKLSVIHNIDSDLLTKSKNEVEELLK